MYQRGQTALCAAGEWAGTRRRLGGSFVTNRFRTSPAQPWWWLWTGVWLVLLLLLITLVDVRLQVAVALARDTRAPRVQASLARCESAA
jgi:hypothetical protein